MLEIIRQHEDERYGNDCLVKDCIVMMKCHEKYIVVNFRRCLGWCDRGVQKRAWKEFDGDIDADYYYQDMIDNRHKY